MGKTPKMHKLLSNAHHSSKLWTVIPSYWSKLTLRHNINLKIWIDFTNNVATWHSSSYHPEKNLN